MDELSFSPTVRRVASPASAAKPAALPPQPERRLAAAVLLQAIDDLERLGRVALAPSVLTRERPRARRILAWFASDDVAWPYSFVNVCAHLRLDPGAVRTRLRRRLWAKRPAPATHEMSLQRLTLIA